MTSSELVPALHQRVTLSSTLSNPNLTLARAAATYILYKSKRLTARTEEGYRQILDEFTANHPGAKLADFEGTHGSFVIEDYLARRYGDLAPRTYNKAHSVISDLFSWHVARSTINRDPMLTVDRAKTRPPKRITFTEQQCQQIFAANHDIRDQIALRLLLNYAIRKGALRGIQLQDFNREKRELVVFTKGEKYHTVHIVEDLIWELLEQLDEPGHHYLLPRAKNRRRAAPKRKQLQQLAAVIGSAYPLVGEAAGDQASARDLAEALEALNVADAAVARALAAASTQTRVWLDEQIGSHALHLWWYRCLTRAGVVPPGTKAGFKMHGARHTAIQRVLDKTGNLKAAQAVAGHKNIGTTGDSYADWSPQQTRDTLRDVLAAE